MEHAHAYDHCDAIFPSTVPEVSSIKGESQDEKEQFSLLVSQFSVTKSRFKRLQVCFCGIDWDTLSKIATSYP